MAGQLLPTTGIRLKSRLSGCCASPEIDDMLREASCQDGKCNGTPCDSPNCKKKNQQPPHEGNSGAERTLSS